MHRSGTSLISQWLSHCGLHLGERLLGPGIGNAEGHFEDLDFLEFHEQILAPAHQFIVTDHRILSNHNTAVFDTLVNKWHFALQYVDFAQI
jgi:hypothetical protein